MKLALLIAMAVLTGFSTESFAPPSHTGPGSSSRVTNAQLDDTVKHYRSLITKITALDEKKVYSFKANQFIRSEKLQSDLKDQLDVAAEYVRWVRKFCWTDKHEHIKDITKKLNLIIKDLDEQWTDAKITKANVKVGAAAGEVPAAIAAGVAQPVANHVEVSSVAFGRIGELKQLIAVMKRTMGEDKGTGDKIKAWAPAGVSDGEKSRTRRLQNSDDEKFRDKMAALGELFGEVLPDADALDPVHQAMADKIEDSEQKACIFKDTPTPSPSPSASPSPSPSSSPSPSPSASASPSPSPTSGAPFRIPTPSPSAAIPTPSPSLPLIPQPTGGFGDNGQGAVDAFADAARRAAEQAEDENRANEDLAELLLGSGILDQNDDQRDDTPIVSAGRNGGNGQPGQPAQSTPSSATPSSPVAATPQGGNDQQPLDPNAGQFPGQFPQFPGQQPQLAIGEKDGDSTSDLLAAQAFANSLKKPPFVSNAGGLVDSRQLDRDRQAAFRQADLNLRSLLATAQNPNFYGGFGGFPPGVGGVGGFPGAVGPTGAWGSSIQQRINGQIGATNRRQPVNVGNPQFQLSSGNNQNVNLNPAARSRVAPSQLTQRAAVRPRGRSVR